MTRRLIAFLASAAVFAGTILLAAALTVWLQGQGLPDKKEVQQRIAELRASITENQARLKQYQWVESLEVTAEGELRQFEQKTCRFGPDGRLEKTPVDEPDASREVPRQLRAGITRKKVEEMWDCTDRLRGLLARYTPPDPQRIQASYRAHKANLDFASGPSALAFNDYARRGDRVTFQFDPARKHLRSYIVSTFLETPDDTVELEAGFSTLPDGTSYLEHSTLELKSKQIQIKTTNFDHKRIGS